MNDIVWHILVWRVPFVVQIEKSEIRACSFMFQMIEFVKGSILAHEPIPTTISTWGGLGSELVSDDLGLLET